MVFAYIYIHTYDTRSPTKSRLTGNEDRGEEEDSPDRWIREGRRDW
jgi:hypothetical protein